MVLDAEPLGKVVMDDASGWSMGRRKVKVMVMWSPWLGRTSSWYRDGIQPRDEEKKKGSILYLRRN